MKYNFAFYTGYGYRGISAHTIKTYYVGVNAENDEEAVKKLDKKCNALTRFNDAFRNNTCGVEIRDSKRNVEKVGCCFIENNVIKWEGDVVYKSPQVFGIEPYKKTIQPTKYIFDGEWVLNNVFTSIYSSYTDWFNYVWNRMGGNKNRHPINTEETKKDLEKYFYKPLKQMLSSDKFNTFEKKEFEQLLTKIYEY